MASSDWDPTQLPPQRGKTFVVTGGTSGIGYFISEQLAVAGARIVLAARSPKKADIAARSLRTHAPEAKIEVVPLDLSSLASIRDAAETLRQFAPLDGLINNAGVASGSQGREVTQDGLELIAASNAFGPFALTALTLPSLRPDGRVVSMGSMATQLVRLDPSNLQSESGRYRPFRAYGYSKHGVHAFALELQRRLSAAQSGIQSLLAHPGSAIDLRSARRPGINDGRKFSDYLSALTAQGKDRGAWPIVRAAIDPKAEGGQFYGPRRGMRGRPVLVQPVASSASEEFGREFWRQAEAATGVVVDLGV
ncbi:SDR family NAD(P)-dependent oxidoreductase [Streptomyces sp. NPDC048290]|uniref:SDR family NAD(P)-dependent oxidoreductase n=1 Tax=Streptomyces sp. NPDC048290 TaxID=3155811 RepID=UPI0034390756